MTGSPRPEGYDGPLCGARKKQSAGTCTQVAGWGTSHVGEGPCKLHGGSTRTVTRGAERRLVEAGARRALADLGATEPVVNPLLELQRLAGEIIAFKDALRGMVERLSSVRYDGPIGEQIRGEIVVYERALDRCNRVLRDIVALRIDERLVEINSRISESTGAQVAGMIRAVLGDLELTPEQQRLAAEVVPRRLRELSGGGPAAAARFEALATRRVTLTDLDREIELLRGEVNALPAPGDYRPAAPWAGVGDD